MKEIQDLFKQWGKRNDANIYSSDEVIDFAKKYAEQENLKLKKIIERLQEQIDVWH